MNSINKTLLLICLTAAIAACAQPLSSREKGVLTGAAIGSGLGAIVGNQTGDAGAGTAIGGGAGALIGGVLGNEMDKTDAQQREQEERMRRQERELERQRREIEELRRQQNYSY